MKKAVSFAFILATLGLAACAPTWVTTSEPAIQSVGNDVYQLTLEPKKEEFNYYAFFRLTVANTSNAPIEIDWNQTYYLINGKRAKGFIFKGVTAEQIKEGTIPNDTVQPGASLVRDIAALRLITWAPIGDKKRHPFENPLQYRCYAGRRKWGSASCHPKGEAAATEDIGFHSI